ncbi:MAG: toll/interleukin-1 receptor domain-containing protein, partial [Planctomycetaceae bacterium]
MTNPVTYHAFLSYRSDDRPLVLRIAEELERRGCTCFLDQWYLVPGHDWVSALEQALSASQSVAIFVGSSKEMGRWQQRERAWALDRQAGDPRFAVIPVLMPGCEPPLGFLGQLMWIDLRENLTDPEQLDRLAAVVRGEPITAEGHRQPRATLCPYRGLMYFREEDATFFFGRDKFIERLVAKVDRHRLVAVVGASGSGKSSLVRAGLLPHLRSPDRERVWEIVTMVPNTDPLFSLAKALLPLIEPEFSGYELISKSESAANDLKNDRVSLRNLIDAALERQQGADRLLLVVDQWEELYTQCEDPAGCQQFIQQVLVATDRESSPLKVVLTVRADFYHQLLQDRALLDHLQEGKLDLGPMTPDELREAIEKPATAVGLTFQDGLVDRLLGDARDEPGRLPLLEFALKELWKRHAAGQMTHSAYDALGRLSGAIAAHAERVYAEFDEPAREAVPKLFRRLVHAGAKTEEDTRRRADLRSLDEVTQRIARRLADERLLVTTRIVPNGEESDDHAAETVEVAHEELLRRWSRLNKWIDADRKF